MYLNKAFIIGNLTRDPELRSTPSGVSVASFGIATSRTWKNKDGQKQEDTQFHNLVAFGPQAKTISQYMKKGSSILVEGRMQTRSWDSPDGKKNYRTEIVVENFQFGPKREGSFNQDAPSGGTADPAPGAPKGPELDAIQYPEEDINPDDIPF